MKPSGRILTLPGAAAILAFVLCLLYPPSADITTYIAGSSAVKRYVHDDPQFTAIEGKAAYDKVVKEVARTYGLESALLHAVISVESRYRPRAVSRRGAAGLMQLMPVIARHYRVADPLDPVQNLHGGAQYLRYLLKLFNNDVSLALAAYNAGETAVARYGNRIPPFRETTKYVPRVLGFYRKYQAESL